MSTQTTTCKTCGATVAPTAYCPECGSPLGGDVRTYGTPPTVPPGVGRRISALKVRGRAFVEQLSAQSAARRELGALRAHAEELQAKRGRLLRDLGEAVYSDDAEGTARVRAAIGGLDEELAAKEERMAEIVLQTEAHVAQVRAESRRTALLDRDVTTPEPVPEPYPPPDEGDPPTPAPIPEPYPPPDEGDPPQPL